MAERELEIGLKVDNAAAAAAADAATNAFSRIEAAALRYAQVLEANANAAAQRAAASAAALAERKAAAQAKADAKAAALSASAMEVTTRLAERMAERQARSQMTEAERAAKLAELVATRAANTQVREGARAARANAILMEKQARDAAAAAKRAADAQIRENDRANAAAVRGHHEAANEGIGAAGRYVSGLKSAMADIVGISAGVGGAIQIYRGISDALAQGVERGRELGREVTTIRESLKDIVAMSGGAGAKYSDLAAYSDLRVKSGLKADAAHDFSADFDSTIGTATDENISKKEAAKLKIEGARIANRTTKDAAGAASLASLIAMIPRFGKDTKADDVIGIVDRLNSIFTLGEGSNDAQRTELNKVVSYMVSSEGKGLATTPQEAAALTAIMSTAGPVGESATGVMQGLREGKAFSKKTAEGGRLMSQADYLTKIAKVGEHDSGTQVFEKIARDALRAQNEEGRDIPTYLKQFFSDNESVIAYTKVARAIEKGTWDKIQDRAKAKVDPAEARRKANEYDQSPEGRLAIANARIDAGNIEAGLWKEPAEIAKKEAEADLAARGELDTAKFNQEAYMIGLMSGHVNATDFGKKFLIMRRAYERARDQGVNIQGGWKTGNMSREIDSGEADQRLGDAYRNAAMIGPIPGTGPEMMGRDSVAIAKEREDERIRRGSMAFARADFEAAAEQRGGGGASFGAGAIALLTEIAASVKPTVIPFPGGRRPARGE